MSIVSPKLLNQKWTGSIGCIKNLSIHMVDKLPVFKCHLIYRFILLMYRKLISY